MRKIILFLLLMLALGIYFYLPVASWFIKAAPVNRDMSSNLEAQYSKIILHPALEILKAKNYDAALPVFTEMVAASPSDNNAVWGMAECLARKARYEEAEDLLNKVFAANPKHGLSLLTLAYIRLKNENINEAENLISELLTTSSDKEEHALAYIMLGEIANKRAMQNTFFLARLKYQINMKCYFFRANELAPELPDTHLAIGEFYLFSMRILGGNTDKAIEEFNKALSLVPNLASAHARLAQAYKMKGDFEKYNLYLYKAEEADPANEILRKIQK